MDRTKNRYRVATVAIAAAIVGAQQLRADTYIYPSKGQSEAQQAKDDGECQAWARKQPGTQPAEIAPPAALAPPAAVPTEPMGRKVVRGGARGAAVGAVGGAIAGDAGKGAAAGAAMGGMVGGMRHVDQKRAAQQQQTAYQQQVSAQQAEYDRQVAAAKSKADEAYKRAYHACLEGRGYTVK